MSLLMVEVVGLVHLAAECEGWSTEVAAAGAPATPASSAQATVAAVSAVHANTGLTAGMLSARMRTTAAGLSYAASANTAQDIESVDELAIGR